MVEAYTAALDAYVHGSVRAGKVKPKRKLELPWYMKDPEKPAKGLSGGDLWKAVDAMQSRLSRGPN